MAAVAERPRVVIVGVGFAGLEAAKALGRAAVDVTVVDRQNHHLFQPLLYQVAAAGSDFMTLPDRQPRVCRRNPRHVVGGGRQETDRP